MPGYFDFFFPKTAAKFLANMNPSMLKNCRVIELHFSRHDIFHVHRVEPRSL